MKRAFRLRYGVAMEVRPVLAGAYLIHDRPPADWSMRTHVVAVDVNGYEAPKTLCGRIDTDRLVDYFGVERAERPTCPTCLERASRAVVEAA